MRKEILAVHDYDLDNFLKSIDLLKPLQNGELECAICGKQIARENLGCVYSDGGEIKICCDNLECLVQVLEKKRRKV